VDAHLENADAVVCHGDHLRDVLLVKGVNADALLVNALVALIAKPVKKRALANDPQA
jgi:hypothetical protein